MENSVPAAARERVSVVSRLPAFVRRPLRWMSNVIRDLYEGPLEIGPFIEAPPPEAALRPSDDKRIDILLSVYSNTRSDIHHWEDRIYQASIFSSGAMLSAVGFFLRYSATLNEHRGIFALGVLAFGAFAAVYLIAAMKAYGDNGRLLVKVEAALGFCEVGTYLAGRPFFGYSGRWVPNRRAVVLFILHLVITCLATIAVAVPWADFTSATP